MLIIAETGIIAGPVGGFPAALHHYYTPMTQFCLVAPQHKNHPTQQQQSQNRKHVLTIQSNHVPMLVTSRCVSISNTQIPT